MQTIFNSLFITIVLDCTDNRVTSDDLVLNSESLINWLQSGRDH
jgi:hypothetical protein